MKINGQEVDMQKVVALYEKSTRKIKVRKNDWWYTQAGNITRERNSERLKEWHRNNAGVHRQKIKYQLTDIATDTTSKVVGQLELAQFLGYKGLNSKLRDQMLTTHKLSNKSKTKTYFIEEIL